MKRKLFVQKSHAAAHLNLRGFLLNKIDDYFCIEDTELTDDSMFVMDYQQLFTDQQLVPDWIFKKISSVSNGSLLIIHDFSVDPVFLTEQILNIIKKHNIGPEKIYIQLPFTHDKELILKLLKHNNVEPVTILLYNNYMHHVYTTIDDCYKTTTTPEYKFSMFSRKFKDWRFNFFCNLIENDLLKYFRFTFSNLDPELREYPHIIIDKNEMLAIAQQKGMKKLGHISTFINNLPYTVPTNLIDPLIKEIYQYFVDAHIHIILETFISREKNGVTLTEKTYKCIAMGKPFLFFGPPNSLDILKKEGFKTFSPFLNENYDFLFDNAETQLLEKINFFIDEIRRIISMTDFEFSNMIEELNNIARYNQKLFFNIAKSNSDTRPLLEHLQLV